MTPHTPAQVRVLVEVAESLAREAGALIRDGRRQHVAVAATKSSAQDVVTAMDLASEALVRRRLAQLRPDDAILGEEEAFRPGTSGITWVVDPIDGTVNYLYGIAAYAVSVAAVVGPDPTVAPDPATWTAIAGCVFAPEDGRTYAAGLGLGATLDGVALRVNEPRPLIDSLVGTGFGYVATRRQVQGRIVAELLPQVRDIRRVGSAALDLCAIAAGTLDLYYERGLQPWDLAAGALIAQEAGAQVTGLRGGAAQESMTVAGPAGRVEELRSILESLHADSDG